MRDEQLPEGWEWRELQALGKWGGGGTPSKGNPEFWRNGDVLWVSPKDMKSKYIHDTEDKITIDAVKNSTAKLIDPPSLLFVVRSGILRRTLPIALSDTEITVNQDIKCLSLTDEVLPEFAYNFILSENRSILKNCSKAGTTVESIEFNLLKQVAIPLPPLPIQQQIVSIIEELFSELDAGVQELKTALARLKTYRQAVLHHYLNNPDWERVKLGEVVELMQYGTSDKAEYNETGVPVIRMGNIQEGSLNFSNLKYFSPSHPEIDKYTLNPGDVLFNRTNSAELVGKTAVYKEGHPKSIFASYLIRLKVSKAVYHPDFLSLYINSIFGRNFIKSVVSQNVGQANVNGSKLKSFTVPLPDLPTQTRIVAEIEERLSEADAMENTIKQELKRAENLRQSILKQAFAGKLVTEPTHSTLTA